MKRNFPKTISAFMLTMLTFSISITAYADAENIDIGQEVVINADGEKGVDISTDIERNTDTSDSESYQDTSGSTNQSTYAPTASEQERANAVQNLVNARDTLINSAMAKAGDMFGNKGTYYQVGTVQVTDAQINSICDALQRFKASLADTEVPDYMNADNSTNNTTSAVPKEVTIDGSVATLTDEEYKLISKEFGCDTSDNYLDSTIFLPNGISPLANSSFFVLDYTGSMPPFSRIFYGDISQLTFNPKDVFGEWWQLNSSPKTTIKESLVNGGLKMADTWTGMFEQYEGYRSNAMNDFVTTTYIREYKVQKVERDILSEINFTSDERQWQVYKYVNGEWVEDGSPIETNNPEHEFRTTFHEAGNYRIAAKQKGVANKTTSVYYATCEYTFDTGSGALIRYQETSIDNGNAGVITLGTSKEIEDWYDTGEDKYFTVNDLGEIETAGGITERVG